VVAAVSCAAITLPRGSLARALIWFLTLPVAGFLVLYDLIDSLLECRLADRGCVVPARAFGRSGAARCNERRRI